MLAAPAAAGVLFHREVPGQVALAFVSFCLISSATYLANDVHDRPRTNAAPAQARAGSRLGRALPVARPRRRRSHSRLPGLALAAAVQPGLAALGAGYLLLTGTYSLWWRNVAVADIAVVAAGFVIRAIAGGIATSVPVSRWFIIVTSFGALFLVAGKRYAELQPAETLQTQPPAPPSAPPRRAGGGDATRCRPTAAPTCAS